MGLGAVLAAVVIFHAPQLSDRKVLRPSRPMVIRLSAPTPARALYQALYWLQHSAGGTGVGAEAYEHESVIDLNQKLVEWTTPVTYRAKPIRIDQREGLHFMLGGSSHGKPGIFVSRPASDRNFVLSGQLKLSPEVPFGPGRDLRVFWISEDRQTKVPGKVTIRWNRAQYDVPIPEPKGQVVAQMVESDGSIVGEARLPISQLTSIWSPALNALEIRPTIKETYFFEWYELFGSPPPSGHWKRRQLVRRGSLFFKGDEQGSLGRKDIGSLERGGVELLFAQSEEGQMVTYPQKWGHQSRVLLLGKKDVQRYQNWLRHLFPRWKSNGFHIGQVRMDQEALSRVRVVGPPFLKIIYLNDLLVPDPNLSETTHHGLFIAISDQEGFYYGEVELSVHERAPIEIYIPEQDYSFGDHHIREYLQTIKISGHDFLTKKGVTSAVVTDQFEGLVPIEGQEVMVSHTPLNRTFLAAAGEGNYLSATYLISGNISKTQKIPLFSKAWLEQLVKAEDHRLLNDQGGIICLFGDSPNEVAEVWVALSHGSINQEEIIFFDEMGNLVYGPTKGGGMILSQPRPYEAVTVQYRYVSGAVVRESLARAQNEWLVYLPRE